MMLAHAERAGVAPETPDRKHFARWCFAVARQCAASDLGGDARGCLELAERAAGPQRDVRKGFREFRLAARFLGWRLAGRLAIRAETLRRQPSVFTLPQSFAK